MKRLLPALLALACFASPAVAQSTVFVVRHAEKSSAASDAGQQAAADPDLSPRGFARADALARMLKEANITAVFATEYKRTQETAAPLAKAVGIETTIVAAKETSLLIQKLKGRRGNALVVGHSNSLPEIIRALGIADPINIAEDDYDNLYVVRLAGQPSLLRLHYGAARTDRD